LKTGLTMGSTIPLTKSVSTVHVPLLNVFAGHIKSRKHSSRKLVAEILSVAEQQAFK
jgi:hypothetical protein